MKHRIYFKDGSIREYEGELEYRGALVCVKPTVGNDHCIPRENVGKVERI